jgi:hypothetical protein
MTSISSINSFPKPASKHLLGVHRATIYRWLDGSMSVPIVVELLLRLMVRRGIRPAEVTASCHGQTSAKQTSPTIPAATRTFVHQLGTEVQVRFGVVWPYRERDMRAVLAARDMAAEGRRAAALDRRHHLELAEAHMAGIGLTPCQSMAAENIRPT